MALRTRDRRQPNWSRRPNQMAAVLYFKRKRNRERQASNP